MLSPAQQARYQADGFLVLMDRRKDMVISGGFNIYPSDLEAELQQRAQAGRLRAVVIRAGDFFGAGSGSWLDLAIAKDVAKGRLVYPGPLDLPHAWAYLPDLARAFVRIAQQPDRSRFAVLMPEQDRLSHAQR